MINDIQHFKKENTKSIWTIKDLLIVLFFVISSGIIFYMIILSLFGDNKTTFRLARYAGAFFMISFPVFWIKSRYQLSLESLGLKKGKYSITTYFFIGITTALIYSLLAQITPLRYRTEYYDQIISYSLLDLILAPLSISGFVTIVLTPIGEEILFRGFIYGYFLKNTKGSGGLLLQALLFSLSHGNFIYENALPQIIHQIILGIIFGILYKKTDSLYMSIVCHGMVNYLSVIILFLQNIK